MSTDSQANLKRSDLVQQVQYNCDISDANHAGNYTLCIYLLKMREYYRWLQALDFDQELDSESMSRWLREKEEIWDQVVDQSYQSIQLDNRHYEPFDSQGINAHLADDLLFYHAGIGQKAVQHFFLADRVEQYRQDHVEITITGKEYARDLTAPPAISTRNEIIVRQESLKRMCWERYQEWHWNQLDNPMGTALAYYPFNDSIPEALQMMTQTEQATLVQHEIGEMMISQEYAEKWSAMMLGLLGSKAELMARAVRDHLADCLSTLPFLIEQGNPASLHFYFANLTHIRKDLFPSAMSAYQHWRQEGDLSLLRDLPDKSALHWDKTLRSLLAIHPRNSENLGPELIDLIEQSRL